MRDRAGPNGNDGVIESPPWGFVTVEVQTALQRFSLGTGFVDPWHAAHSLGVGL